MTWALGEAAKTGAHQPWRYAEAILKDCLAQGLHTLAEYERARRGWGRNARPPEREIRPEQDLLLLAGDKLPVFRKLPGREKEARERRTGQARARSARPAGRKRAARTGARGTGMRTLGELSRTGKTAQSRARALRHGGDPLAGLPRQGEQRRGGPGHGARG